MSDPRPSTQPPRSVSALMRQAMQSGQFSGGPVRIVINSGSDSGGVRASVSTNGIPSFLPGVQVSGLLLSIFTFSISSKTFCLLIHSLPLFWLYAILGSYNASSTVAYRHGRRIWREWKWERGAVGEVYLQGPADDSPSWFSAHRARIFRRRVPRSRCVMAYRRGCCFRYSSRT